MFWQKTKVLKNMKIRCLTIFLLFSFVSCGNDSAKNDKLVDLINNVIENNEYTVIYFGAHWCGPCTWVFENKMTEILDADYDNLGCITIFFDSGDKIRNNENIMKYSPILLPSFSGLDKMRTNDILGEIFSDYNKVNYMPIMMLCDKEKNILNYTMERYIQFDKNSIDRMIKNGKQLKADI